MLYSKKYYKYMHTFSRETHILGTPFMVSKKPVTSFKNNYTSPDYNFFSVLGIKPRDSNRLGQVLDCKLLEGRNVGFSSTSPQCWL
jgi:hypothetical protein